MRHLTRGLRAGIGLIRTAPVASTAAMAALALGIGFSTTMFSIVHGATRGLPFPSAAEIVAITKIQVAGDSASTITSGRDYDEWTRSAAGAIRLEAFTTQSLNLGVSDDDPIRISAAFVTPASFARLGVAPAKGRDFNAVDAQSNASAVVMLSDSLWDRRFGRDPSVVGKVIRLDGDPYVVIGVMPERFGFPIRQDVWLPFAPAAGDADAIQVWGRLSPGVTRATARNAIGNVAVIPFTEVETPREVIVALYVLLVAVSGVLVIACVNVANLFIARAAARARDTAVRLALGASRRALLWEQAGEAAVLAVVSALPGRGAGSWLFGLDAPVVGTATGTTAVTFVSAGYLETLNATALRGRMIEATDRPGTPSVAVVNESWVRRFSADRDPIGRQVYLGTRAMIIVGVVPDLMPGDIQDRRQDGVYASILQQRPYAVRVVARNVFGAPMTPQVLREAITRVDPELPLYETMSVRAAALYDKEVLTVLSSLFGVFGAGAVSLTAIGLFSVMTLLVALRMREFGIRLALGATPRDLVRLVAGQASRQVIPGLVLGLALGFALTQVFASAVETITVEPWSLLALVATTVSVAAGAALVGPTWTATRLNPVRALRAD